MNKLISALLAGLLFGAGLAASGMTDTAKVIGFLDIFGQWDADLLFVMGGAVITTAVSFRWVLKRKAPLFDVSFKIPLKNTIDKPLLIGAIFFGIGWGLFGYCPGPAVAAIIYLQPITVVFIITMLIGMFLGDRFKIG